MARPRRSPDAATRRLSYQQVRLREMKADTGGRLCTIPACHRFRAPLLDICNRHRLIARRRGDALQKPLDPKVKKSAFKEATAWLAPRRHLPAVKEAMARVMEAIAINLDNSPEHRPEWNNADKRRVRYYVWRALVPLHGDPRGTTPRRRTPVTPLEVLTRVLAVVWLEGDRRWRSDRACTFALARYVIGLRPVKARGMRWDHEKGKSIPWGQTRTPMTALEIIGRRLRSACYAWARAEVDRMIAKDAKDNRRAMKARKLNPPPKEATPVPEKPKPPSRDELRATALAEREAEVTALRALAEHRSQL